MEDDQKVRIGGIKFSEELVQITVTSHVTDTPSLPLAIFQLLQQIANKNINVTFLCHSKFITPLETVFCVAEEDIAEVSKLLRESPLAEKEIDRISSVGTLTIFPHRNEFSLLGRILHFFGSNNFPIHSLSTSISAIGLNTNYQMLDEIALEIQNIVLLPENHAPFRQDFKITQIQQ